MNSLSKTKAKYIKSLQLKKNRSQEGLFIVEGEKSVLEFLNSDFKVQQVVCTEEFLNNFSNYVDEIELFICSKSALSGLGSFKSNNSALAVVEIPKEASKVEDEGLILALDHINDPGNLGTIIRIADWFGIGNIILSPDSVDVYSPKVVSATKGSLTRIKVFEKDLKEFFSTYTNQVIAADLDGEPLVSFNKIKSGIILMGSESHGINHELIPFVTHKVTIPRIGKAESLNVAVATGIVCNHLLG